MNNLREALNQLLGLIDNEILVFDKSLDTSDISQAQYHIDKAVEAYEKPLRNCDVGTAEDQINRFIGYCTSHKPFCIDCPLKGKGNCGILWAQMPFWEVKK